MGADRNTSSPDQTLNLLDFIPRDAFDSHMHVIDIQSQPLSPDRTYTPPHAPLTAALNSLTPLLPQLCIIQPSVYGLDNSCTLAALGTLGKKRACAVIEFDPVSVTEEQMHYWNEAGVRGVRINWITSRGIEVDLDTLETMIKSRAELIRPWGWVLQLYAPMSVMDVIGDMIPSLGVPVVFDHFAFPSSPLSDSSSPAGLSSILNILSAPTSQFYIKVSAPYRLDYTLSSLRPLFDLLYRTNPDRLVFATDWPHTRFDGYDTVGWIKTVVQWCLEIEGELAVERLFKTNAETLWRGRESNRHLEGAT